MSAEQKAPKQDEHSRFEGCVCAAFMKQIMGQEKGWDCAQMMGKVMEMRCAASREGTTSDQKETP